MSLVSDMLDAGFSEQVSDHGSQTVTYLTETVPALWSSRTRMLEIEEGPKSPGDTITVKTRAASWTVAPTEGKVVSNPATGEQWRVFQRILAGSILSLVCETVNK